MIEYREGFQIVSSTIDYENLACQIIATCTGLNPANVIPFELAELKDATRDNRDNNSLKISRDRFNYLINKYVPDSPSERITSEYNQRICQATDLLSENKAHYLSYGLFAVSYIKALLDQEKEYSLYYPKNHKHHSLLVGAYTIDTSIEYTAVVKRAIPNSYTHIIDIQSAQNKPGLLLADGLCTPFKSASISSVHTNYLFHMLQGHNNNEINILNFLKEAYRILEKYGKLIMCEGKIDNIFNSDFESGLIRLTQLLRIVGFSKLRFENASEFINRRKMIDFFRSSHGDNIYHAIMNNENPTNTYESNSLMIIASK